MDNFNIKKTKTIQRKYDFVVFLNLEHNEIVFVGKEIQKKKTFFRWVFFLFQKNTQRKYNFIVFWVEKFNEIVFFGFKVMETRLCSVS